MHYVRDNPQFTLLSVFKDRYHFRFNSLGLHFISQLVYLSEICRMGLVVCPPYVDAVAPVFKTLRQRIRCPTIGLDWY